ncbi:MAG: hypothetical protein ACRDN0_21355 [Trebonia sp.]
MGTMRVIQHRVTLAAAATVAFSAIVTAGAAVAPIAQAQPAVLSTVTQVASTVPGNGDLNPYDVAVVPRSEGSLYKGNVLVSNFNNSANQQGTGTTIVEGAPDGKTRVFAQINPAKLPGSCPGGIGLTTALSVLSHGWVMVGSLPTMAGDPATLFVTNVLNGTVAAGGSVTDGGTVVRLVVTTPGYGVPRLPASTTIGSGFPERTDPAALVIGPTGVGLGRGGTLYVADTLNNRIAAIPGALFRFTSAGTGRTVTGNGRCSAWRWRRTPGASTSSGSPRSRRPMGFSVHLPANRSPGDGLATP